MYVAKLDAKHAVGLSSNEQMDEYLDAGYEIYETDLKTGESELIASPEKGYLIEKPVLKKTVHISFGGNNG